MLGDMLRRTGFWMLDFLRGGAFIKITAKSKNV